MARVANSKSSFKDFFGKTRIGSCSPSLSEIGRFGNSCRGLLLLLFSYGVVSPKHIHAAQTNESALN
jgi:hypothetical protein